MKFHMMTSSCLFNRGTTFLQTVTYNNHIFLPANTKSLIYKHTHSALRWLIQTEPFTTALEAESPASSEISDFMPYAHALSNILHINALRKLMIRVWCFGKFVGLGFMLQLEKEKQLKSKIMSNIFHWFYLFPYCSLLWVSDI